MALKVDPNLIPSSNIRQRARLRLMLNMAKDEKTSVYFNGKCVAGEPLVHNRKYSAVSCQWGTIKTFGNKWQYYDSDTPRKGHVLENVPGVIHDDNGLLFRELLPNLDSDRHGFAPERIEVTDETESKSLDQMFSEDTPLWVSFQGGKMRYFSNGYLGRFVDDNGDPNLWFQGGGCASTKRGPFEVVKAKLLVGVGEVIKTKKIPYFIETAVQSCKGNIESGKIREKDLTNGRWIVVKFRDNGTVDRLIFNSQATSKDGKKFVFRGRSKVFPSVEIDFDTDWFVITAQPAK